MRENEQLRRACAKKEFIPLLTTTCRQWLKFHFSTPKILDFLILNRDGRLTRTEQLIDCGLITVFQDYYAMMTLRRTRTAEQSQNFNPSLIPGSLSSYKPMDWGYPKTFIYGGKTFIWGSRCSIDTYKWLEYLLQSLENTLSN